MILFHVELFLDPGAVAVLSESLTYDRFTETSGEGPRSRRPLSTNLLQIRVHLRFQKNVPRGTFGGRSLLNMCYSRIDSPGEGDVPRGTPHALGIPDPASFRTGRQNA